MDRRSALVRKRMEKRFVWWGAQRSQRERDSRARRFRWLRAQAAAGSETARQTLDIIRGLHAKWRTIN